MDNTTNNNNKTAYLFVPGLFSTERWTSRYTEKFTMSTDETAFCETSLGVLSGASTYSCNFGEIVVPSERKKRNLLLHSQIASLILGLKRNFYFDECKTKVTGKPLRESITNSLIDFSTFNLGGVADVEILSKRYQEVQKDYDNVVLYSVSRGTRALNLFLTGPYLKLDKSKQKVKAAVFEGAIDSIEHVLNTATYFHYPNKVLPLQKMLSWFTGYEVPTIHDEPIGRVNLFPKDIPVLYVTSKADCLDPPECTKKIANALAKSGHTNVYLRELEKSSHPNYMWDDKDDREKYQRIVNAFYKKYGLPVMNQEYAEQGEQELEKIKLSS